VKIIAVIPARGDSKRIKNKNIKLFFGKPMIAWTIIAAKKAKVFKRILVSTDNIKIAKIAKKYGAEVPFLRDKFIDDISPISRATIYDLNRASNHWKEKYDIVVQLMANCPLRNHYDIKKSLKRFIIRKRNFQISCFKFGWMNPWWSFKLDKNKFGKPLFPTNVKKRSQDLPDLFCPTGAIWIARVKELFKSKSFYGKKYCLEEINWMNAIDIDDNDDLNFAKIAKNFVQKKNKWLISINEKV
tara:strand:+ start:1853 stop:2581 length:729 start_codon:yes stop_codon:yes gene_type:complete